MENQSINDPDYNDPISIDGALSIDEFTRLIARYKSVGYESYYNWKLALFCQQMPWSIDPENISAVALSSN